MASALSMESCTVVKKEDVMTVGLIILIPLFLVGMFYWWYIDFTECLRLRPAWYCLFHD